MYDSIEIGKHKWGGETFKPKYEEYEDHLEEMLRLYKDELLSFEEIGQILKIDWWNIKELFKKHCVDNFSITERSKLKRQRDYPLIFDLHQVKKKSLNQIYMSHGFSPAYSRLVLKEGNDREV